MEVLRTNRCSSVRHTRYNVFKDRGMGNWGLDFMSRGMGRENWGMDGQEIFISFVS